MFDLLVKLCTFSCSLGLVGFVGFGWFVILLLLSVGDVFILSICFRVC